MGTFLIHMRRSLQSHIFEISLSPHRKAISGVIYLTTIYDNGSMVDHFLIATLEVYIVKPTAEIATTTAGSGGAEKRNRKSEKSTSKKSKSSNDDDSELKNSKPNTITKPRHKPKPKMRPKPRPRSKPTSLPALAPKSDSAVVPVPLPVPTTTTPSTDAQEEEHTAEGLSPNKTTTTSNTVAAAAVATTSEIPFSVPLSFAAPPPPLLFSEDVMRGKGGVLRDV